jgi:putative transposase
VNKDYLCLSLRRQCSLLSLERSSFYCQPRGESADSLACQKMLRGASEVGSGEAALRR